MELSGTTVLKSRKELKKGDDGEWLLPPNKNVTQADWVGLHLYLRCMYGVLHFPLVP